MAHLTQKKKRVVLMKPAAASIRESFSLDL
jgi:hypothetical protein